MRQLIEAVEAERRLSMIFPRPAFDTVLSNPLAGWAVAAMIYAGAVADDESPTVWARPSTITWQQDSVLNDHRSDADRLAWRTAAARSQRELESLLAVWGERHQPRYRENSRETLRDETLKKWNQLGAVRRLGGVPTSSSRPTWALEQHFADLFDPALTEHPLAEAITAWIATHMAPGQRLRAQQARQRERQDLAVTVALPDGQTRVLEPGRSSQILKNVIEVWAPSALTQPVVLTISEPSAKLLVDDELLLAQIGLTLDVTNVLPDALIADIGSEPVQFWIIEAVATDGPITDSRRSDLLAWAQRQGIDPSHCRFLTAFESRGASVAKRRLKDLGSGTLAWFMDEPDHELTWRPIVARWDLRWPR